LVPTLRRLLGDPAKLGEMAERMRALSRPDAAARLAAELLALAKG
jgi:UDP-N-acetylglucosamine:LPS N-acetylglucosamine transferase